MGEDIRGATGSRHEVVKLEDAVHLLVEHLVVPVLPLGQHVEREEALSPDTQQTVARQVHAVVLLYNYYHRKQFPQLEFAGPERFSMSASLTVSNKNLLMYLNHAQKGVLGAGLSVTDKAIIAACDIAKALDPTKDSPEMLKWPITKVAVVLVNLTKNVCLLEHGTQTEGVWSVFEKDICPDMSAMQGPTSDKSMALPSKPYGLQQIAYSEVELKTGMKRTNFQLIGEHRVYSLSLKETTTMVFLLQYDQTVETNLKEMPLDVLIQRMSGPIFESGSYPTTTSIVECYHLLPYKEVLLNVLNRDSPLGSSLRMPKELEANKKDRNYKRKVSKRNYKRKFDASKTTDATFTERRDYESPTKDFQSSLQMGNNRIENNSNVPQDIIPKPDVYPIINDHALKSQKENVIQKSDGITGNRNVQRYTTLQLLQKMRDDMLHEHFVLGDRCAEYEMDIQTILTEVEMTPRVMSILKKYENSSEMMEAANPISYREGCQTINIKRKKLKEAILLRNKCQELEDICRDSNWILPRYRVLPSVSGDMYQGSVYLTGPDFNLSADGDMKVTPHGARDSAASNMLSLLEQKARED